LKVKKETWKKISDWMEKRPFIEKQFLAFIRSLLSKDFQIEASAIKEQIFLDNRSDIDFFIRFSDRPRVSILVPVYNTQPVILRRCLDSVLYQTYRNWELCIVDDASTDPAVEAVLKEYRLKSRRIRVRFSPKNAGIAATINRCARMAGGEFLGVLDHDDEMAPHLLFEYVSLINQKPDADLIYCDEDKIDTSGNYCDHWFKSDWNPDLSLSFNYVMHFALYRRKWWEKAGGMRETFEGSQDYDLLLRIAELTPNIYHVPKILYHWRMSEDSVASGPEAKPHIFTSGLAALNKALERRRIKGDAIDAPEAWKGVYRVKREIDRSLFCSIIILYNGNQMGLSRLKDSIESNISFKNHELIICGNASHSQDINDSLGHANDSIRWVAVDGCNIPQTFNEGVKRAHGDLLFFLTDAFELLDTDSFDCLVEQAQRDEVGAVGGRVYYANGLVEHGGVILGPFDILGYAHRATPDTPGYAGLKHMTSNFSAVMGYGMMTRRLLFMDAGGFDEEFATAYWDVDYCLRLRDRGYLITYTPYARLIHHIPVPTLSELIIEPDATRFKNRWQQVIDRDPYFNPNFSRQLESFECSVETFSLQEDK
jgi:O-antigen biosynthesis protein